MSTDYVSLSELITDEAETDVTIGSRTITVGYAPTKISAKAMRTMARLESLTPLESIDVMPVLVPQIVTRWNLREDPTPAQLEAGTTPPCVPLTAERLEAVPSAILMRVIGGVFQHMNMGKETGTTQETDSPARSAGKRRR